MGEGEGEGEGERGRERGRERERERAAAAAYLCAQLQPSRNHNHVVKAYEIIIMMKSEVRNGHVWVHNNWNSYQKENSCVTERGSGDVCTETVGLQEIPIPHIVCTYMSI